MSKLIVTLFVLLAVMLCGCDTKVQTGEDPLSQILYEQDAEFEEIYEVDGKLAGLFDNATYGESKETHPDKNTNITDTAFAGIADNGNKVTDKQSSELPEQAVSVAVISQEDTVWISETGKKYHGKPDCSGMKNPSAVMKNQAELDGYTACKRCFK